MSQGSEPERPLPPPPTLAEVFDTLIARVRLRHPWLDPTRAVLALAACVGLAGMAWALLGARGSTSPRPVSVATATTTTTETSTTVAASTTSSVPVLLVVDASGALRNPGPVRVRAGSRVEDVIAAAGGVTESADLERVDRAAKVSDGERVYVPRRGQSEIPDVVGSVGPSNPTGTSGDLSSSGSRPATPAGPVDLNTATAAELVSLPGVGPSTASAIVAYRARNGRFRSVDDLMNVRGIGPAKLATIRPHATV